MLSPTLKWQMWGLTKFTYPTVQVHSYILTKLLLEVCWHQSSLLATFPPEPHFQKLSIQYTNTPLCPESKNNFRNWQTHTHHTHHRVADSTAPYNSEPAFCLHANFYNTHSTLPNLKDVFIYLLITHTDTKKKTIWLHEEPRFCMSPYYGPTQRAFGARRWHRNT